MTGTTTHRLAWICALAVLCTLTAHAGDWPQWRGPNGDGVSTETGLLKDWPEGGPEVAWEIDNIGEGYSTACVVGDRIYTQGNVNGVEHIIALNAADGSLIWAIQPEPVKAGVEAKITKAIADGDANGDGQLEEAEALRMDGFGWDVNKAEVPAGDDAAATAAARAARLMAGLDGDNDGSVTMAEGASAFRQYFRDLDQEDPNADADALADARAAAEMDARDANDDDILEGEELNGSWLRMFMRQIDKREQGRRGDGKLTLAEVLDYLKNQEPGRDGKITEGEMATYYAKALPNRDGLYSTDELRAHLSLGYTNGQGNGPRGTPTFEDGKLYVQGGFGDVACLNAEDGSTVWHVNLIEDFGGPIPYWGFSESILITGDMAIITPGGEGGTVAALNKTTGEVIWRANEVTTPAEYSTAVPADIGGIAQIVQFAKGGVYGLSRDEGRLLWTYDHAKGGRTINIATPIVADDHVLLSSSYGNGAGLAKITTADGAQSAEEVWFEKALDNHHGGLIKLGDHVYGTGNGGLVCINYLTGEIAWQDKSVGKGSLTIADGMIYMLGERHEIALVEASPDGYVEHGRFGIENLGKPSWTHPVVANGRLYIRNQNKLTAYNISAN
ncbi:MAG TPA: PQQ-binding-like beta-propeller repeat protein [Armatimonadota bacterium]|nr:PQQ-binding-like beta-propeller repeat protein [Armatimonadota bacterium]